MGGVKLWLSVAEIVVATLAWWQDLDLDGTALALVVAAAAGAAIWFFAGPWWLLVAATLYLLLLVGVRFLVARSDRRRIQASRRGS